MLNSTTRILAIVATISLLIAASDSWAEARVSGVRGHVTAVDAAGSERALQLGDRIANGDRLVTSEGSALGILSGEYYTGLDQSTDLVFTAAADGRPAIELRQGHTRVINAGEGGAARISTPGLLAAQASSDTEAFVFPEKAWVVSMVCTWDAPTSVGQVGGSGAVITRAGDCAVGKPPEGIYTAPASHERLAVLDGIDPNVPLALRDRFDDPLPPVALGLPPTPQFDPTLPGAISLDPLRVACDDPNSCQTGMGAPPPVPPPVNPPVPGPGLPPIPMI